VATAKIDFVALQPNFSVDSDTLRQGAAQCRWKSCTARPLAATCRSPLRYSGGSGRLSPHGVCGPRTSRPSRAGRPALACRPRPVGGPRTAAAFLVARVHRHSPALRPARAGALSSAVAGAAGFTPSARPCESEGPGSRPSQAKSDAGRCGPLQSECRALGVRQEPRHNEPVDSDAQLRTLPAVAPVGRRSPLRYASGR